MRGVLQRPGLLEHLSDGFTPTNIDDALRQASSLLNRITCSCGQASCSSAQCRAKSSPAAAHARNDRADETTPLPDTPGKDA